MSEHNTQPMLETILKELRDFRIKTEERFSAVDARLFRIEIRLDKIESIALEARAIAQETRLDLKHLREQLNLHAQEPA